MLVPLIWAYGTKPVLPPPVTSLVFTRGISDAAPPVSVRADQTFTPGAATSGRRRPLTGSDCGVHAAGSASVVLPDFWPRLEKSASWWLVWS
jgi:hypothetical protein